MVDTGYSLILLDPTCPGKERRNNMMGEGIGVKLLLIILFGFFILWLVDEGDKNDK